MMTGVFARIGDAVYVWFIERELRFIAAPGVPAI